MSPFTERCPKRSCEGISSSEKQLLEAFRNETAKTFVQDALLESYTRLFSDHIQEADAMVRNAFHLLSLMMSTDKVKDNGELKKAFGTIHNDIILDNDWFPPAYALYRKGRAVKDYNQIKLYIGRNKVLDFGCGAGYLDLVLKQNGFIISSTDVIEYDNRISKEDEQIAFRKMSSPTDIEYPDNSFDTIILWHVLHHIDKENLSHNLKRLSAIGKRFIIKEDVYGAAEGVEGFTESKQTQKKLCQYMTMEEKDQIQSLIIYDYVANIILGQSILDMNMPFQFKTVDQWKNTLSEAGFDVIKVLFTGCEPYKLHNSPQALIIADSRKCKS